MQWVERAPMHGPAFVLPRSDGQPVFVDPHGNRVRRLRHGARVLAGAAAVYLALLALGLAGPATPPFSLFPGDKAKAGEAGAEAVRAGAGSAVSAEQVRKTAAALTATLLGAAPATTPGGPAAADPAAPGAGPPTMPSASAPDSSGPGAAPASTPAAAPSNGAPGTPRATQPSGRSGPPSGSGPGSAPPAGSAPGTTPSATPAHGPPPNHVPPGQAKKADGGPGNGNGNANGNAYGPPDNHGQQTAAQHSYSPNH